MELFICEHPNIPPKAWEWIRKAANKTGDTIEYLQGLVYEPGVNVWYAVNDEQEIVGAGQTRILDYAGTRALILGTSGGNCLKEVRPILLESLKEFARQNGCTKLRYLGREGWLRVFPGFKPVAIMAEMEV